MAADSTIPVWPGKPYPLGTKTDAEGTNFAIFSENASAVDLCLFSHPDDAAESASIRMTELTDGVWHCFFRESRAGSSTATGCMVPTIRTTATASMNSSSSSILMPALSRADQMGRRNVRLCLWWRGWGFDQGYPG